MASAAAERSVAVTFQPRRSQAKRQGDRAGAGAQVGDSRRSGRRSNARQRSTTNSVSGRGTSTAGETLQLQRPELPAAGDVGERFARGAALHRCSNVGQLAQAEPTPHRATSSSLRERRQRVAEQDLRVEHCAGRAAAARLRGTRQRRAHRCVGKALLSS